MYYLKTLYPQSTGKNDVNPFAQIRFYLNDTSQTEFGSLFENECEGNKRYFGISPTCEITVGFIFKVTLIIVILHCIL